MCKTRCLFPIYNNVVLFRLWELYRSVHVLRRAALARSQHLRLSTPHAGVLRLPGASSGPGDCKSSYRCDVISDRTRASFSHLHVQVNKHLFVHIGQTNPTYSDPFLEAVDIRQVYDKFPEKKGGLKELFERGPTNAFFLVKFWVRERLFHIRKPLLIRR